MRRINMMSKADQVKGQGVLSASEEQISLVKKVLEGEAEILKNGKIPCQITHYHSIHPEFYLSLGKKKRQGIAVGSVHFLPETVENSISLPRPAKEIFYRYMLSFYKRMDRLVTVNPVFVDKLEELGIPRRKVTYIPNVVSREMFHPLSREKREQTRKKYGISREAFTVLGVGQLQRRKGIFDFVETARKLPQYQFVWAGDFSFGRISEGYEQIRTMLRQPPANVKFLGLVERERMNEIYNMADVMFLPSYEELFPMTILESMNCGLPALVRDLDIYEPILFDHALRGKKEKDFIRILRQLREDPEFYQRSALASFSGSERYSQESVGAMWKEFYEKLFQEQEKEERKKRGAVRPGKNRKGGGLWENKKRQFV